MNTQNSVLPPVCAQDAQEILSLAKTVFETEIEGLQTVRDSLDEHFTAAIALLQKTLAGGGKIVVSGVGKNLHIAEKLSATLASTGSTSVVLNPSQAIHGDLGILASGDVLIALSYSGESEEIKNLMPAVRRLGIPILAITGNAESTLGRLAQALLPCKVAREACPFGIAPTTSTTATLALGDALAMTLLNRSGFRRDDFAKLHPGGAIGRTLLLRASDIMRTGEKLAVVSASTKICDVVVAMTRARGGAAYITDENGFLKGIFTDGDFRRAIAGGASDVLQSPVSSFMTPDPVSVHPEDLAVDILRIVEKRAIDDVPVTDEAGRLAGCIDIQDLPKFKIM